VTFFVIFMQCFLVQGDDRGLVECKIESVTWWGAFGYGPDNELNEIIFVNLVDRLSCADSSCLIRSSSELCTA